MIIETARKARGYYPLATRKQRAAQAAAYAFAIKYLGDKWLLAKASARLITPRPV